MGYNKNYELDVKRSTITVHLNSDDFIACDSPICMYCASEGTENCNCELQGFNGFIGIECIRTKGDN